MKTLVNVFDQVYSRCKDDNEVAEFLRAILAEEAGKGEDGSHFHHSFYLDALERAISLCALEKALDDEPRPTHED